LAITPNDKKNEAKNKAYTPEGTYADVSLYIAHTNTDSNTIATAVPITGAPGSISNANTTSTAYVQAGIMNFRPLYRVSM
jgi:hypothetical protein